jgi:hypothetical protein
MLLSHGASLLPVEVGQSSDRIASSVHLSLVNSIESSTVHATGFEQLTTFGDQYCGMPGWIAGLAAVHVQADLDTVADFFVTGCGSNDGALLRPAEAHCL